MSAPIGPGDWVRLIRLDGPNEFVKVGGIYCVSEFDNEHLMPCRTCGDCETGVQLAGVSLPWDYGAFCPCELQLIYRPSEKLIADLLTTIPAEPERIGVEA